MRRIQRRGEVGLPECLFVILAMLGGILVAGFAARKFGWLGFIVGGLIGVVVTFCGVMLVIYGCSWQPGYGGRNDRKPGMEVERYFGWPACFYADLWRSDKPTDVEPWSYAPPLPITSDMHFVYCSFGAVPLLFDAGLVIASIGLE